MGWLAAVGILAGCSEEAVPASDIPVDGKIALKYSIDEIRMNRSVGESFESVVNTLDVLIFDADGSSRVHYQHIPDLEGSEGTITLDKDKTQFTEGQSYQIHLIANSKRNDWSDLTTVTALKQAEETTNDLHLSQSTTSGNEPTNFLMYGEADVILNAEDQPAGTIELKRAAAKIQIVLEEGMMTTEDNREERFNFAGTGVQFYFVNYQNTTHYIYDEYATVNASLGKTDPSSSVNHIKSGTTGTDDHKTITITTYAYANDWQTDQQAKMTHLVVKVPYVDGDGETRENNFYKIPVSESNKLLPNHLYTVHVSINAIGSTQIDDPIELEDIDYDVLTWISQSISIGGEAAPHYLALDKEELEMRNVTEGSVTFASSGQVTITDKRVYYYNKYGVEIDVSDEVSNEVTITPSTGISGTVDIYSPVPTNNLIRYIEFTVTNKDDECEPITVTIKQYPQEYITYYFGYYSYRDDFVFHWENQSVTPRYVTALNDYNGTTWNKSENRIGASTGFFGSKMVEQPENYASGQSGYDIKYYYWKNNKVETSSVSNTTMGNPRMYHVQINSSALPKFPEDTAFDALYSDFTYELGIPRKDKDENGNDTYTATDEANNELVSPSFMIASRLGTINGTLPKNNLELAYKMAATHCAEYVETYYPRDEKGNRLKDAEGNYLPIVTLDDWRLPTKAELLIIMRYQGSGVNNGTEAMDYLLNGGSYMGASGSVTNPYHTNDNLAIRCIRDHYVNKEEQ